jgi:ABC-type Fe3+ transport system permease subunit
MFLYSLKMFAAGCSLPTHSISLLSFPTWYEYLPGQFDTSTNTCSPAINGINDVWLIAAAAINILLRVAAILAVVFIIYGGIQYTTSQGSPERTDQARKTVISAVVGLAISVSASVIIGYVARKLSAG